MSSPRSPTDGGEVGQWASRFGDSAWRSIKTSSTSRTKQPTPRDGGGSTRGDCEIASPSGRVPGWPRQSRGRIVPTKESQNWWNSPQMDKFDVDRLSRFHVEGSRQSPPLIRTRCGLRGIRVAKASHPGSRVRRRRRVGSSPDSTMSEDRGLLDSLAHDLEFDGDVSTTLRRLMRQCTMVHLLGQTNKCFPQYQRVLELSDGSCLSEIQRMSTAQCQ